MDAYVLFFFALALAFAPAARGQRATLQRDPHIGYVYPAGGRQGETFEVTIGGQLLDGASKIVVSGEGVRATVLKHAKPPTQKQINEMRQKLLELRQRMQTAKKKAGPRGALGTAGNYARIAEELGLDPDQVKAFNEYRKKMADPKRQLNPQLAETVALRVELDASAEPGRRELRLKTSAGLSNPLRFDIGQWQEHKETEPNDATGDTGIGSLPVTINGQILPGDVDRFRFQARQGERLVVAADARELMPYLADAVPGWFQATLTLFGPDGKEVAYADDFRFHPDPVLYFEIPDDGNYELEIKDAVYRGREDFVYRITIGQLPFVTSIFPLGGRAETPTNVELEGWNLSRTRFTLDTPNRGAGIQSVSLPRDQQALNRVLFARDTLPESSDEEPNNELESAQRVQPPLIVNGRIDEPGDWDVFRFEGQAGSLICAEVKARRLNSPLDSVLKLTDAVGRQVAANDDFEDKAAGLTTHHADSRIQVKIPAQGTYYLHLGDTQNQGGRACGYRLHINAQRPDFALRVVPASINARAGSTVPITVHALRQDGFDGDIVLALQDAPAGFRLGGGWVPAGQDQVRLTLTVPPAATEEPIRLQLEGRAKIQGRVVQRQAVPAEDMVQAFIYHHLVPAQDLMVSISGRPQFANNRFSRGNTRFGRNAPARGQGAFRAPLILPIDKPVQLPAGGTARVPLPFPNGPVLEQIALGLSDPPAGISIQKVPAGQGRVAIQLQADADKAEVGRKGNLIVEAFVERTTTRQDGKPGPKRRVPVGTLPAIPFEIVKAE